MPGNSRVRCSKVSYPMHEHNTADETEDERDTTELLYEDRQALTEGEEATLVYDSPYSGTRVERTVTVVDTSASVTVETEDGTEWCVFGDRIRTTVNSRRASGTERAANGRTVGTLVDLSQESEEPELMTDGGEDPEERNVRAEVMEAAADALANYTSDATTGASYAARRGRDKAFDAAMAVLRGVPVDERPDGLVAEVEELTQLATEEHRGAAEEALREAAEDAREPETWRDLAEDLERGERVEVSYRSTNTGETVMLTATVCKSNAGGMRLLPDGERRLLVVKTGWRVIKTKTHGASTAHRSVVGEEGTVVRTGETRAVTYEQRSGWTHVDEEEAAA